MIKTIEDLTLVHFKYFLEINNEEIETSAFQLAAHTNRQCNGSLSLSIPSIIYDGIVGRKANLHPVDISNRVTYTQQRHQTPLIVLTPRTRL